MYRSADGANYEEVATVDKALREYFDLAEVGTYYYKVTAYRSYCESTPAWTNGGEDFVFIEVTSVGESEQMGSVFPNPANERLCVEAENLQQVTIYNVMGQMVHSQRCDQDGTVIAIGHLATGVYTISIKTASGTITRRFSVIR